MTTTQNLNLPQWEASDRIMRTDFNAAMASIDAALTEVKEEMPRIVTGSYVGNGAGVRTISLPQRVSLLFLQKVEPTSTGDSGYALYEGCSFYMNGSKHFTHGGTTIELTSSYFNMPNTTYRYWALTA